DDVVPLLLAGEVDLVINTPWGVGPRLDGYEIRAAAVARGIPCITTIQGAAACVQGIEALVRGDIGVRSLQEHHAVLRTLTAAQDASSTAAKET
ncbi:MAG: carbamoyl-phosphate synthase large subunit, partial [Frankiales bacterium]|nr:carbamoyl-phosphate synthase large subunit [Frankiales bacterium]